MTLSHGLAVTLSHGLAVTLSHGLAVTLSHGLAVVRFETPPSAGGGCVEGDVWRFSPPDALDPHRPRP